MSEAARHEAKKVNMKARELQGASQDFFRDIAAYFESLSGYLTKVPVNVNQGVSPWSIQTVNDDEVAAPLSRSHTIRQKIRCFVTQKYLEFLVAVPVVEGHMRRFSRAIQHGHLTKAPTVNIHA